MPAVSRNRTDYDAGGRKEPMGPRFFAPIFDTEMLSRLSTSALLGQTHPLFSPSWVHGRHSAKA